jgi:hypothetical protein
MPNPLSALYKGIKQNQDEAVEASKSIADKYKMARSAGLGKPDGAPTPTAAPTGSSPKDRVKALPYGSRPGEKRIDTKDMTKPLGSFKKGGAVKKTGVYKLHAKERVLNAKQTAEMAKMAKMAKKGGMAAVLAGKC